MQELEPGPARTLVEGLDLVFWEMDPDGRRLLDAGERSAQVFGIEPEELQRDPTVWLTTILPEDLPRVHRALAGLAFGRYDVEYRMRDASGRRRWIHSKGFPVLGAEGCVESVVGFSRDVTSLKERERELRLLADELEAEARHRPPDRRLEPAHGGGHPGPGQPRPRRSPLTAVLVDLDAFARVNATFGRATGDLLLRRVAERLADRLGAADVLARVDGDRFLALLPGTDRTRGREVAERLRLACAEAGMTMGGQPVTVTASLGVATIPASVVSLEEVLEATGSDLERARRRARDPVSEREPPCATAQQLRDLLLEGRLEARAQSLRDPRDGRTLGYEMLSRGPAGPFQSPTDLLRFSLEAGLLTITDLACLRTCLAATLPRRGDGLGYNVNLLPSTIVDTPAARLIELFEEAGGPERFCVEVNEQQFVGAPADLIEPIRVLRGAGVRIAVDDVGYGKSSLETLVHLEPDVVKVAREMVAGADRDPVRRAALGRMARASRALSASLVAEGVETEGERDLVIELGFDLAQGYLWDRPAPLPV